VLTFRAIAAGALSEASAYTAHLLEQTLPDEHIKLADYYGRSTEGAFPHVRPDIDTRLAEALDLKPGEALTEERLGAILSGRRADKADLPGKKQALKTKDGKHRVSGMDLCFSAPKSVSVAWAHAKTDAERYSILQCHIDANAAALRYVEETVGTRVKRNGVQSNASAKMAWITINHFTARATVDITRPDPVTGVVGTELYTLAPNMPGDPELHSHNIVPNLTVGEDGKFRAIDTMQFHWGRKKEFGAVYQAFLAANLRRIGIEVDLCDRTLMAKLAIIPQYVCDAFSKRTKDARQAAREAAGSLGKEWEAMPVEARVAMLKRGAKDTRRAKADDLANFAAWKAQAEAIGWKHETAVTGAEERHDPDAALQTALPLLASLFKEKAVIYGPEARLQAVRGLIQWGIRSTKEIGDLTRRMVKEGVIHDGRLTRLHWAETDKGVKVTTALHIEQERELIDLVRRAYRDKSRALTEREIDAAQGDVRYDGKAGQQQHAATRKLGKSGAFGLLIGAAGAGKTKATLRHLTNAYKRRGYDVWGTAQAWRQAEELKGCGIHGLNVWALQPFLDRAESGRFKLGRRSVVVLDEISQVGTLEFLRLLRLQAKFGFQVIATGDHRQCQSVTAGPVIDLLREALGDAIPEILVTVRQQSEREQELSRMFRDGEIEQAIGAKRKDATAELVPGGFEEAVERIADLAVAESATVCAPTNAEAHAIGKAIRKRRGIEGGTVFKAVDKAGDTYDLALAAGDRVRLFKRTHALFGNGRDGHIGNNGTVLEIAEVLEHGIKVKAQSGKIALIRWERIRDEDGRVMLAYGDALTIDAAQGLTSDRHILALPGGSKNVDGFRAYVGMSRHRVTSWIIGSEGAEMREAEGRRPLGVRERITQDHLWANVIRNLSRRETKETATEFQRRVAELNKKTTAGFQAQMRQKETLDVARFSLAARGSKVAQRIGLRMAFRPAA